MTKSFKMVVLSVLLEADAVFEPMPVEELAQACHAWLCRDPGLFTDIEGVTALKQPRHPEPKAWLSYWKKNPLRAWTLGPWFDVVDNHLIFRAPRPPHEDAEKAFMDLTREVVDWRLTAYRKRHAQAEQLSSFSCPLKLVDGEPALTLPGTSDRSQLPTGWTTVRMPDGAAFDLNFLKTSVKAGKRPGSAKNGLPDLLRMWFGPRAGAPSSGAACSSRAARTAGGWSRWAASSPCPSAET